MPPDPPTRDPQEQGTTSADTGATSAGEGQGSASAQQEFDRAPRSELIVIEETAEGDGEPEPEVVEEVAEADAEAVEPEPVPVPVPVPAAPPPRPPSSRASTAMAAPPPPPSATPPPPSALPGPSSDALEAELAEAASTDWARRAEALRQELEAETDRARGAFLAHELGELTERRLRDEAGAVKLFGKALQADPSLRPNLWAIRRIFYRRNLWPNLLKLLDAEMRFCRDDAERADLLLEKGQVLEDRLKDRAGARDAYDRAIALHPDGVPALLARERIALAEKDTATLEKLWRALADASHTPARRVAYLVDLVELHAARGEEGVQTALELVAEAVALGADRARVVRMRERLAERADDPDALLAALEARVAMATEAFGPAGVTPAPTDLADPGNVAVDRAAQLRGEIVACRRRAARVAARAGDTDRAWNLLEQAAALVPGEPLLLMDLANLAEETGRHAEVAELCARLASLDGDATRQLALALRRADALARAGRDAEADAVLDQMVASAPGYLPVIALRKRRAIDQIAATAHATGGAAWERVAGLYLAEAAAARLGTAFGPGQEAAPDPLWAASAYVAAGDVFARHLGRGADAESAYGQALETLPGFAPALWALVALHERAGDLGRAAELIEAHVEGLAGRVAAEPDVAGALEDALERAVRLREEEGKLPEAVTALRRLCELTPDDASRKWRLVDLLGEAGRHGERLALLGRLAEHEHDPLRRAEVVAEMARAAEEDGGEGGVETAIAAWRQVLELRPDDRGARARLAALVRRAGRWEELAMLRRAEAAVEADAAVQARALREAAAVLERRLHRGAEAAAVYQELAERAPEDPAGLVSMVESVAASPELLAGALERLAAVQTAETGLGRTLLRLGETYERLGREADAAQAFLRAREAGGAGTHADWALWQMASRGAAELDPAEALAALCETRPDDVRADLLEEAAWLSAGELETAAARFQVATSAVPTGKGALLGKALVAARRRDAGELAAALEAQAEHVSDPAAAAGLLLRAATLRDGLGARDQGAALAVRAAERVRPEAAGAAGVVLEAAERPAAPGQPLEARAALLERRAALATDPRLRAALDLERAEELEQHGRLADAGRLVTQVLARDPDDLVALAALRRLARRSGDGETLARASFQLGLRLGDPESAAACLAEAARIVEEQLHRPADAARLWRLVLDKTPLDEEAFAHAHALAGDDPAAIETLLGHRLRHVGDAGEEVPLRVERAALRVRQGDLGGAARDLEKVLAVEPTHAEALRTLAGVRRAQKRAAEAAELYAKYLATGAEGDVARAARLELAQLKQELGDAEGAAQVLEGLFSRTAVTGGASDLEARERYVAALEQIGDFARAAEALEQLGALRGDRALRARDELRVARLYRHKLRDAGRARRALERARGLDPLGLDIVKELAGLLEGADRQAALGAALADVRAALAEEPGRPDLYERVVGLAGLLEDEALARFAGGALVAMGAADPAQKVAWERRVAALGGRHPAPRGGLAADALRSRLMHPGFAGPLAELWAAVHDAVAALGAHEPGQLGFAKGDRVAAKHLAQKAPLVDAWLRLLGLADVEVYVSAGRGGQAFAPAVENLVLLVGADVAAGETVAARAKLGRALATLAWRHEPVCELPPDELELVLAAAMKVGGGDPARVPALARGASHRALEERARALGKALTRRGKKALPAALARLGQAGALDELRLGARASAARFALLASGDVAAALAAVTGGQRLVGAGEDPLALDLFVYALAEDHLDLRKELGI